MVSSHSLGAAISAGDIVSFNSYPRQEKEVTHLSDPAKYFKSLTFLPGVSQLWTEYLGAGGDSWYRDAHS